MTNKEQTQTFTKGFLLCFLAHTGHYENHTMSVNHSGGYTAANVSKLALKQHLCLCNGHVLVIYKTTTTKKLWGNISK